MIHRYPDPFRAPPELSICVPTLNIDSGRADRLRASLLRCPPNVAYEVIVADCGGKLRGYTAPMNEAMAAARLSGGDLLLAVNDDVAFSPGWFGPLAAAIEAGAWCATPDATHTDGPQVFHPWMILWDAWAWEEIGGLDEQFIHHASDIDLARRLVDAGHPPVRVVLPEPVVHELNASSSDHRLGEICAEDLRRFERKWGVGAEAEKHRLAALDLYA